MPKLRAVEHKYPPINWLLAAILERKKTMGLEWSDVADKAGMSQYMLRKLVSTKEPQEWPTYTRERVCKVLGIDYQVYSYVSGSPEDPNYGNTQR